MFTVTHHGDTSSVQVDGFVIHDIRGSRVTPRGLNEGIIIDPDLALRLVHCEETMIITGLTIKINDHPVTSFPIHWGPYQVTKIGEMITVDLHHPRPSFHQVVTPDRIISRTVIHDHDCIIEATAQCLRYHCLTDNSGVEITL